MASVVRRRKRESGLLAYIPKKQHAPYIVLLVIVVVIVLWSGSSDSSASSSSTSTSTSTSTTTTTTSRLGESKSKTGGLGYSSSKKEQQERQGKSNDSKKSNELVSKRFIMELGGLTGESSTGTVILETKPEWAPLGAKQFHDLVEARFFDECRFFRVLPNFIVQFGINGTPETQKTWRDKGPIPDDAVLHTNARGTITYAMAGKNTRTTQLFVNKKSNAYLDKEGFAPFAEVVQGMDVLDRINSESKEKPNQGKIQNRGNDYLNKEFPNLSYVVSLREDNGASLQA